MHPLGLWLFYPNNVRFAAPERHRRDGFEASNADKIFESTTMAMGEGKK